MPEYNIVLSERFIEAAELLLNAHPADKQTRRAVYYLGCLSAEIALKALLEKAGYPIDDLKKTGHKIADLLALMGECEIQKDIANGRMRWLSGHSLRAENVDRSYGNATVGTILTGEDKGASKYPNQIRYGDSIKGYSPQHVLGAAKAVVQWGNIHWKKIRLRSKNILLKKEAR